MQSQKVARNIATTILAQIITWSLAFAVTIYLPNYLGPAGLGKLASAASISGIASVFVSLGVGIVITREIARDRARTGELITAAILMRVPLGILAIFLSVSIVKLLPKFDLEDCRLVGIYCSVAVITTISTVLAAGLQGQEKMARQNIASVIEKVIFSIIMIGLVKLHKPLWMFAGVGLISGFVSICINASAFRSLFHTLRWPKIETMRWITKAGLPFMGVAIFTVLYGTTDPFVLRIVANDITAGWYSAAYRLLSTTLFLPNAVTMATFPVLSRLHHEKKDDEFKRLSRRAFSLVMLCGIPIGLALMLLPRQIMDFFPFKDKFQESIPVLGIGGAGVILWFAAAIMGNMVIAHDKQKMLFRTSMMACSIGVPLCFGFSYLANIYWHNGAVGAVASDVVLETFLIGMYLKILPKGMFDRSSVVMIGKCAAASIPMALFLYMMTRLGMGLWIVFPSALIYAIMCFILRCIVPEDLALISKMLQRRQMAQQSN